MDFEEWYLELQRIFADIFCYSKESIESFDKSEWREFYEAGYSPYEAVCEEVSEDR